jgi:hypothetical protein
LIFSIWWLLVVAVVALGRQAAAAQVDTEQIQE